ncbi:MAG: hypothetical protein U0R78_05365 [Nocardioidaceae bacterium]
MANAVEPVQARRRRPGDRTDRRLSGGDHRARQLPTNPAGEYEQAAIDLGASPWSRRHAEMLLPMITPAVITSGLDVIDNFVLALSLWADPRPSRCPR